MPKLELFTNRVEIDGESFPFNELKDQDESGDLVSVVYTQSASNVTKSVRSLYQLPYTEWTDSGDTPYASKAALLSDMKAFFFKVGAGTGGSTSDDITNLSNVEGATVTNALDKLNDGLTGEIIVTQANVATTFGGVIDSTKRYRVIENVDTGSISCAVPSSKMTIVGNGANVSSLYSSEDNYTMFESPAGVGSDLVLSGMSNPQYDKSYIEVVGLFGQYQPFDDRFSNDGVGETDYKVFSYDDTGVSGKFFVVMNANIGNLWTVFETSVDPLTYVNDTLLSSTNGIGVSATSETQGGKNVPDSSEPNVSYSSIGGGSGDFIHGELTISVTGAGSKCYDLKSDTGLSVIDSNRVIWLNCTSRGIIDGYAQGTESVTVKQGGTPTLEFSGSWLRGYRVDTSQSFLLDDGNYTLYKAGDGLVFNGRFRSNENADLIALGSFSDFSESNFAKSSSFQLIDTLISREGLFNSSDLNITPNISSGDLPSMWAENTGIKNTHVGGIAKISTEIETALVLNTPTDLLGTWTPSDLQHFSSPVNGHLMHDGDSPIEYMITANFTIEGGSGDVIEILLRKWNEIDQVFENIVSQIATVIDSRGGGGLDAAFFTMVAPLFILRKGDYVDIPQVTNLTDNTNVTAMIDSFYFVTER